MSKKRVDILDMLPPECVSEVDRIGYEFLEKNGYNVAGAESSKEAREAIREEMQKRGEVLKYSGAIDGQNKVILVWFTLSKGRKIIARSRGMKFIVKEKEPPTEQ